MKDRRKIYKKILSVIAGNTLTREQLISRSVEAILGPCPGGVCPIGPVTEMRGRVGAIISEMLENGILSSLDGGLVLASPRPIALRAESCEKEIINLLRDGPRTKAEIREALIKRFGTDMTESTRDDNILFSLIGHVTKRLVGFGLLTLQDGKYSISDEKAKSLDDIAELAELKSELLARIHAKGGEFFEHYILTLLAKHLESTGKKITECYVTGGTADGGIDGVIKTTDTLGFREHLMIQAKNRLELANETAVRGFYGAVCAAQGTRGVFATTSDFHPSAAKFLSGIDNCVGVNADMIFKLACECEYGVKRHKGKYTVDTKLLG